MTIRTSAQLVTVAQDLFSDNASKRGIRPFMVRQYLRDVVDTVQNKTAAGAQPATVPLSDIRAEIDVTFMDNVERKIDAENVQEWLTLLVTSLAEITALKTPSDPSISSFIARIPVDFPINTSKQISPAKYRQFFGDLIVAVDATMASGGGTPPTGVAMIAPADMSTGLSSPVNLSWTAVGADTYDVWVKEGAGAFVKVSADQVGTTYALTPVLDSTNYQWYIDAKNAFGTTSLQLTPRSFTTAAPPLGVPTNLQTDGTSILSRTFSWDAAANAVNYELFVGKVGETPALLTTVAAPAVAYFDNTIRLPQTGYDWFVKAKRAPDETQSAGALLTTDNNKEVALVTIAGVTGPNAAAWNRTWIVPEDDINSPVGKGWRLADPASTVAGNFTYLRPIPGHTSGSSYLAVNFDAAINKLSMQLSSNDVRIDYETTTTLPVTDKLVPVRGTESDHIGTVFENATVTMTITETAGTTLDIATQIYPNFEDIFIQITDTLGVVAGDYENVVAEVKQTGTPTWTRCRDFMEVRGASQPRWVTVIEKDIDREILPATSYAWRLTYNGLQKSGTVVTKAEPGTFTTTNNPAPVATASAIIAAIADDTTITISPGTYFFDQNNPLNILNRTKLRIVPQTPGTVTFSAFEAGPASYSSVGSGVFEGTTAAGLADTQYAVFYGDKFLKPHSSLANLQSSITPGFAWSGDTTIYIKLADGSSPDPALIRLSRTYRMCNINNGTDICIKGIKWEGCTSYKGNNPGVNTETPRMIYMTGTITRLTIDGITIQQSAGITAPALSCDLIDPCFQDNTFGSDGSWLDWNGLKNSAVGNRNYEGLSSLNYVVINNESRGIVVRRNKFLGPNCAVWGDINGQGGPFSWERPDRSLMAMSVYENQFGNLALTRFPIDDAFEIQGNVIGYSQRRNKHFAAGAQPFNNAPSECGPFWYTSETVAKIGRYNFDYENQNFTRQAFKNQHPTISPVKQSLIFPSGRVAFCTMVFDPPEGQTNTFGQKIPWASYTIMKFVDYRKWKFNNNIWKCVTTSGGTYYMALFDSNDTGNTYAEINDIIHDGDIFDFGGPGTELFSDKGGSPTTIAAYNANRLRLFNCLKQSATLSATYVPTTPVAKSAINGYSLLVNRGSPIPLS